MKKILALGVATIMLSACSGSWMPRMDGGYSGVTPSEANAIEKQVRNRADYWMRADHVTAEYMTGPKAQHQLHSDIAKCVAEVRELVRLGSIQPTTPPKGVPMDQDQRTGWVSPTRNGPLYMEYQPYSDFDGCMRAKGWDRLDFVKPVIADRAAHNYNGTILGMTAGSTPRTTARYDTYGNDQRQNTGFNQ
ncbi:MAG: hypothetical protein KGQ41_04450 [Alphaproteobacteria bacterium]|nr:hypothetical protein [Alphaproteobacteria bacterium]